MDQQQGSVLSPYRVLDLTEGEYLLGGRLMGDLGADVIQIEKPGGSPSRSRGPFYKDIADREKSLFWFAFCLNKRGITLDIESADGREMFKKLVGTAHFVFESFQPGYLDKLGLGYSALSQINPGIILVSITHFGQNGPKSNYKGTELTDWASGSALYASGDPDRPPCVTAVPLAGQQGATAAVLGALTAHWYRKTNGEGQHVDVSIQEVMEWHAMCYAQFWSCSQIEVGRGGWGRPINAKVYGKGGFACKDGYSSVVIGGTTAWMLEATVKLHQWMEKEGMLPDWLKDYDWATFDLSKFQEQAEYDRYMEPAKNFLATRTKAELWRAAVDKKMFTAPVRDFKDNFEDVHMRAREFWVDIAHPELGEVITYPGACFKLNESPLTFKHRAPLIGEHNQDIYQGDLGLSGEQMAFLKANRVI